MRKKAIYPGTFDPLTNGHLNIIQRACKLFDMQERVALAKQALASYANVTVVDFEGLLVDLAQQQQAEIIVRGVRSIADFEYETQMAGMNRKLMPELETIFLTTHSDWADLSSTLVRDIARHQGNISTFVPANIEQAVLQKLR